jgi:RHS repeat-associated protein
MGTGRFRYDQVSRLIRAELRELATDHYQDYAFDMFSNITAITTEVAGGEPATENYPVQSASTTPTNRLAAPHVYDASGNMTVGKGTEAAFDLFNMISGYCTSGTLASCSGEEWAYVYSADDERVASYRVNSGSGTDRVFTLRDLGNRLLSRDEMRNDFAYGHFVQDYVWRGDRLVGARHYAAGTMRHFGLDHLGTIRVTTDGLGVAIANHTYHPFGSPASSTADGEPMKFTGHERDLQSTSGPQDDVDYMHARFYGPGMSRFMSVDPVSGNSEVPASWNRYAYVRGNPLSFTDPTGEVTAAQIATDVQTSLEGARQSAMDTVSDGSASGVFLAFLVGSALDLASTLVDPLKAGDAVGDAAGSGAGALETAGAVLTDTLRTAALAAPAAGLLRSGATAGASEVGVIASEGIYEFTAMSGRTYVGQSGNITRRLAEHVRAGRLAPGTPVRTTEVLGGRTTREVAEQLRINELGGIQVLENVRNPIGPNRAHLLSSAQR